MTKFLLNNLDTRKTTVREKSKTEMAAVRTLTGRGLLTLKSLTRLWKNVVLADSKQSKFQETHAQATADQRAELQKLALWNLKVLLHTNQINKVLANKAFFFTELCNILTYTHLLQTGEQSLTWPEQHIFLDGLY